MKRLILALLLLVVVAGGGFAWYYFQGPCGVSKVEQASTTLNDHRRAFDDALRVALSTSRISLAGPVSDLQQIQRDVDGVSVPACVEAAKGELSLAVESAVAGTLAFMGQEADTVVSAYVDASELRLTNFDNEMEKVAACAPFC